MLKRKILGFRAFLGLTAIVALVALMAVPVLTRADGNRVYYTPDQYSFTPPGTFGGMIPEGYGNGINKLRINAGTDPSVVNFTINNNNNGTDGTTFFETRKGPGNNDLSGKVKLSSKKSLIHDGIGDFTDATNTATLNFPDTSSDVPLYVQVEVPPCTSGVDYTFRIQAHPGGTDYVGNGPGVVVFVSCTGSKVPGGPLPICYYDYSGNIYVIDCPKQ